MLITEEEEAHMKVQKVTSTTLDFTPKFAVYNEAGEVVALTRTDAGAVYARDGMNKVLGWADNHTYGPIKVAE
jgi:hypothetical protein